MAKRFINDPQNVVTEMLEGLCLTNPALNRLDGFPNIKVVFDKDFSGDDCVAVISGGGSGHEPHSAGMVGKGMLAAAVCGDVFASPPAEAILAAVRTVTGKQGCLLVVTQYTGDRLNFGLAAEQAKASGLSVEMIVVGDDCALPGTGVAGRRGIAGTIFVQKVAGAAAGRGASLADVKAEAEAAAAAVGSMGVAATTCTIPGAKPSYRLGAEEMELGLGIHGEAGAEKGSLSSVNDIVAKVVDTIVDRTQGLSDVALMVNNLGCTPNMELYIAARAAVRHLQAHHSKVRIRRIYVGTFMTSLDMVGFSVTLLQLTPDRTALLDAPVQAPAWPSASAVFAAGEPPAPVPSTAISAPQQQSRSESPSGQPCLAERCISAAAAALLENAARLDDLDQRVGDGDTGSTLRRGAEAVVRGLQEGAIPLESGPRTAGALADCARAMGGTSGAIYNIFFTAAAASLRREGRSDASCSAAELAQAFGDGANAIAKYGGAKPGDRTMLDAMLPACDAFSAAAGRGEAMGAALKEAAKAALQGTEETTQMTAAAGRSSYVPSASLNGVPDPGAQAVALWLSSVAEQF